MPAEIQVMAWAILAEALTSNSFLEAVDIVLPQVALRRSSYAFRQECPSLQAQPVWASPLSDLLFFPLHQAAASCVLLLLGAAD